MKNVVLLHGTGETKDSFWYPWLTDRLGKKGYSLSLPQLPDADTPDLAKQLPVALREHYSPETIVIGHSSGGPLLLSVLENISVSVKQAILVAGYARPKEKAKPTEAILQCSYNWDRIASNVADLLLLNSDNDPWNCTDVEGRYILDNVGKGKLIIMKGEGHMGSDSFDQPYREFPFLLKLIDS